jgi:hypothetical protein
MLGKRRLVGLLGLSAGLLFAAAACKSDDGEPRGLSTEECSDACAKVAAADCGDVGSECVDQCVHGPVPSVSGSAGDCTRLESAYFSCFWGAASYTCDEKLGTLPVGCDDERSAVKACESGDGAGGSGGADGDVGGGGAGGAGTAPGGAGGAPSGAEAGAGGAP